VVDFNKPSEGAFAELKKTAEELEISILSELVSRFPFACFMDHALMYLSLCCQSTTLESPMRCPSISPKPPLRSSTPFLTSCVPFLPSTHHTNFTPMIPYRVP
jgi:hypothetical protein